MPKAVSIVTGLAGVDWTDEDGEAWMAYGHWTWGDDGRLQLTGLELWKGAQPATRQLLRADDRGLAPGEPAIVPAAKGVPAEIAGADLRRIPLATVARRLWAANVEAERALRDSIEAAESTIEARAPGRTKAWLEMADAAAAFTADEQHGARRRRLVTDELLADVSELYRAALTNEEWRRRPTEFVASRMHTSRSSAARYVMRARQNGLLPQEAPGRPKPEKSNRSTKKARKR